MGISLLFMDGFSKPTIQTVNYLLELAIDPIAPWLGEVGENSNEWLVEVRTLMETFDIGCTCGTIRRLAVSKDLDFDDGSCL